MPSHRAARERLPALLLKSIWSAPLVPSTVTPVALMPVLGTLQVSVGLQGRWGPREEVEYLLFLDSEETRGPWDTRGRPARKVSDGRRRGQRAEYFSQVPLWGWGGNKRALGLLRKAAALLLHTPAWLQGRLVLGACSSHPCGAGHLC